MDIETEYEEMGTEEEESEVKKVNRRRTGDVPTV